MTGPQRIAARIVELIEDARGRGCTPEQITDAVYEEMRLYRPDALRDALVVLRREGLVDL